MGRHKKGHLSWVVIVGAPEPHFLCKHCGETRALQMPVSSKRIVAVANAFQELHAECSQDPTQTNLPIKET